ncbi:hypothetical protein V8E55_005217 [Tylopilus felleus]
MLNLKPSFTSSDPEAPIPLEFVEDDFTEEEHRKLDKFFRAKLTPANFESLAPFYLSGMLMQLGPRGDTTITAEDCLSLKSLERTFITPRITSHAARLAWVQEYRGNYATIMLNNINGLPRSDSHPNCIPLIQSSGYGKSRLVDELAKLVFTIPLNIRNPEEDEGGVYPPADADVWEYLCNTDIKKVEGAEHLVALFLSNLFLEVASEVRRIFSPVQLLPQNDFAQRWRDCLLTKMYASRSAPSRKNTFRSWLYEKVVTESRKALTQTVDREKLTEQLRLNLTDLLAALDEFCAPPDKAGKSCVKIMLHFDEAHGLAKDIGRGKKLYDAVWSILAEFQNDCVFTIFLSTESSIFLLAPSREPAQSQYKTAMLWGPITETPFDCHPIFSLRPGRYSLENIAKLEFIAAFGRPLFWTMLETSRGEDRKMLLEDMMNLARMKLLCSNHIDSRATRQSPITRIAILDVLITIDYEPRRELTYEFEMELIPFIAEAANRQLHHFMKDSGTFRIMDDLIRKLDDSLIDLGQKGEMVMCFLLRRAYMDAIIREQKDTTIPNFSTGQRPRIPPCALQAAFQNAVVPFTHFAKAADCAATTTSGMTMGFLRGVAIIGHYSEDSVDIAIPILLDRNDKQRHKWGTVMAYLIDVDELGIFPDCSVEDARPYVTLIAELGASAPSSWEGNVDCGKSPQLASARHIFLTPRPRYSICAYECTHQTWNVVCDWDCHDFKHILSVDDLLGDHTSQDEVSLQVVPIPEDQDTELEQRSLGESMVTD